MDCVFCKIVAGEVPCDKVYEDDFVLAFKNIDPRAPIHLLVIPKMHITNFEYIESEADQKALGQVQKVIGGLVKKMDLKSYQVLINGGSLQQVKHIHYHLMSGFTNPRQIIQEGGVS